VSGIAPWWEELSVTLLVGIGGADVDRQLADDESVVLGFVAAQVCRRPEESSDEWHWPSDRQFSAYTSAVRDSIRTTTKDA